MERHKFHNHLRGHVRGTIKSIYGKTLKSPTIQTQLAANLIMHRPETGTASMKRVPRPARGSSVSAPLIIIPQLFIGRLSGIGPNRNALRTWTMDAASICPQTLDALFAWRRPILRIHSRFISMAACWLEEMWNGFSINVLLANSCHQEKVRFTSILSRLLCKKLDNINNSYLDKCLDYMVEEVELPI